MCVIDLYVIITGYICQKPYKRFKWLAVSFPIN